MTGWIPHPKYSRQIPEQLISEIQVINSIRDKLPLRVRLVVDETVERNWKFFEVRFYRRLVWC